jgi:hypothetical protein
MCTRLFDERWPWAYCGRYRLFCLVCYRKIPSLRATGGRLRATLGTVLRFAYSGPSALLACSVGKRRLRNVAPGVRPIARTREQRAAAFIGGDQSAHSSASVCGTIGSYGFRWPGGLRAVTPAQEMMSWSRLHVGVNSQDAKAEQHLPQAVVDGRSCWGLPTSGFGWEAALGGDSKNLFPLGYRPGLKPALCLQHRWASCNQIELGVVPLVILLPALASQAPSAAIHSSSTLLLWERHHHWCIFMHVVTVPSRSLG